MYLKLPLGNDVVFKMAFAALLCCLKADVSAKDAFKCSLDALTLHV